ncbi:MAG: CRISPR-associated endonuclease Cas1, partial [Chromatiaceae bacterium]|nr:CRISPR-associated endonuclease Cas1 [Chromatiaceae bacterium]
MTEHEAHRAYASLLPLRAITVTLEFLEAAELRFFHQPALTAFLRFLLESPADWDWRLVADAVETGRGSYRPGDRYRFSVIALPGGEGLLESLIERLWALPRSAPKDESYLPFRDNLRCIAVDDLFKGTAASGALHAYDIEDLARDAQWLADIWPEIRWRWLSPAQLLRRLDQRKGVKGDARYCSDTAHVDAALVLARLQDTLREQCRRRGLADPPPFPEQRLALEDAEVFWVDADYRDAEGKTHLMGGMMGLLTLAVDKPLPPAVAEAMILGQYLGIGQRRAFGWGRYRIEDSAKNHRCARAVPAASLLERAVATENLASAYGAMEANREARQGADAGLPWQAFDDDLECDAAADEDIELDTLASKLGQGAWKASPLRVCVIQEKDGDLRVLCVPPFIDRVAQRAVVQVLTPGLDGLMSARSHGYRRGRSRHSAAFDIQAAYRAGYRWVYEGDIEDYFDSVNLGHLHNRLMALYGDDPAVEQIMAWMKAPLDYEGRRIERDEGLPQGSPLSPVLANLMLDDFDSDMAAAGFHTVRFADDFVVLCKDPQQARAAENEAKRSLAELGLDVNPGKTRIVPFEQGFHYLGYLFVNDLALDVARNRPKRAPAPNAAPPELPPKWLARLGRHAPKSLSEETLTAPPAPPKPSMSLPQRHGQRGEAGTLLCVTGAPVLLMTREGRLVLERGDEELADVPWGGLQAVLLFGSHHMTSPALRAALEHRVPVHFASGLGRYQGTLWDGQPATQGHGLWLRQQRCFGDMDQALAAARILVEARLRHLREVLRQVRLAARTEAERDVIARSLAQLPEAQSLAAV